MENTEVHVSCCDSSGKRFVTVADQEDDVRFEALKLAGKFYRAKAYRLRHGRRSRTFQLDINFPIDREAVLANHLYWVIEPLQNHCACGYHLKIEIGMLIDRAHDGFKPPVVGTVHQHY